MEWVLDMHGNNRRVDTVYLVGEGVGYVYSMDQNIYNPVLNVVLSL